MDTKNILNQFFPNEKIFLTRKKRLIVLVGSFADFDSFEYCQNLSAQSKKLSAHSIDWIVIGIGSEKSRECFCKFNKIESKNVLAIKNSDLHEKLNLDPGLVSPLPAIINLLIMCAGINSKGTINEVLRGYVGDKKAKRLFSDDEDIKIGPFSLFKGKMFRVFNKKEILRPFELATKRLINMIEILSNWNTYVPNSSFLTQRGATILIDENDKVLYRFNSKSLLGYSSEMSSPLSFIDNFLN